MFKTENAKQSGQKMTTKQQDFKRKGKPLGNNYTVNFSFNHFIPAYHLVNYCLGLLPLSWTHAVGVWQTSLSISSLL